MDKHNSQSYLQHDNRSETSQIKGPIQNEEATPFEVFKGLFVPPLSWKVFFYSDPSLGSGSKMFKFPLPSKYIDRLEFNIKKFQSNYFLVAALVNMIGMLTKPILFLIIPFILFLWYLLFMRRRIGNRVTFSIFGYSIGIPTIWLLLLMGAFSAYVMFQNDNFLFRYILSFIGIVICFIHASFRVTGQEGEYDMMVGGNRSFQDLKDTVKELTESAIKDVKSIYHRRRRSVPSNEG